MRQKKINGKIVISEIAALKLTKNGEKIEICSGKIYASFVFWLILWLLHLRSVLRLIF